MHVRVIASTIWSKALLGKLWVAAAWRERLLSWRRCLSGAWLSLLLVRVLPLGTSAGWRIAPDGTEPANTWLRKAHHAARGHSVVPGHVQVQGRPASAVQLHVRQHATWAEECSKGRTLGVHQADCQVPSAAAGGLAGLKAWCRRAGCQGTQQPRRGGCGCVPQSSAPAEKPSS